MLASIHAWLQTLQVKDYVTGSASLAALLLTVVSYFQKKGEGQLALRKQLTDILEKITTENTEIAKFKSLTNKEGYPPNYIGLLNDQRRFFTRQAAYLSDQVRDLVSPYEYLLIAGAFDSIDSVDQAERYFHRALWGRKKDFETAIALRGYGRFLFSQGRSDEARQKFSEAVSTIKGSSDRELSFRGDTYERWAGAEEEFGDPSRVTGLLSQASETYEQFLSKNRREGETKRVATRIANRSTGGLKKSEDLSDLPKTAD